MNLFNKSPNVVQGENKSVSSLVRFFDDEKQVKSFNSIKDEIEK